jgi:hypothetical protein
MRGKKTSPEVVYQVMALWFTNYNLRETARTLDLPLTTVKDIVDKNKNAEAFEELRTEKQKEFSNKATEIIEKGLLLLNRRLERAIEEEETLDELIDDIEDMDDEEMSYQKKQATITKIRTMQLHNLKDLTTAIGTLYDKRALSKGESTQNVGFSTNLSLDKLAEISGFKKDADAE